MTEVRSVSSTGGEKGTKDERFDLLPTEALAKVARHYGIGAQKYEAHNWRRGYEWSKSYAALMRHLTAFWGGEDIDEETGSPHMAAVTFHALALLTFMDEQREFDDRYKPGPSPLAQKLLDDLDDPESPEADWMTEDERAAYNQIIKAGDTVRHIGNGGWPTTVWEYKVLAAFDDKLALKYDSPAATPFFGLTKDYAKVTE